MLQPDWYLFIVSFGFIFNLWFLIENQGTSKLGKVFAEWIFRLTDMKAVIEVIIKVKFWLNVTFEYHFIVGSDQLGGFTTDLMFEEGICWNCCGVLHCLVVINLSDKAGIIITSIYITNFSHTYITFTYNTSLILVIIQNR